MLKASIKCSAAACSAAHCGGRVQQLHRLTSQSSIRPQHQWAVIDPKHVYAQRQLRGRQCCKGETANLMPVIKVPHLDVLLLPSNASGSRAAVLLTKVRFMHSSWAICRKHCRAQTGK